MRRRMVLLASVTAVILIGSGTPSYAAAVAPYQSRPHGQTYQAWLRTVGQFYLGDSSNPLIAGLDGDCGKLVEGVFILAASEELAILITHSEIDEEQARSIVPYLRRRWRAGRPGE